MRKTRPLTEICHQNGITLTELAIRLGRKHSTVKKWTGEVRVPANAVLDICQALGGSVSPAELRPDVFGRAA